MRRGSVAFVQPFRYTLLLWAAGLGWLVAVLRLPIISLLIRAVYAFVSKHRRQTVCAHAW